MLSLSHLEKIKLYLGSYSEARDPGRFDHSLFLAALKVLSGEDAGLAAWREASVLGSLRRGEGGGLSFCRQLPLTMSLHDFTRI